MSEDCQIMASQSHRYEQAQLVVRVAKNQDVEAIWAVDSSATQKFASIPALADLAAPEASAAKFHRWLQDGKVYVAEKSSVVIGFIAVRNADNAVYIDEISVHQDHQGKGVGQTLLETVFRHARDIAQEGRSSVARVSLITYADVPWNGPWYSKQGFREVYAESIGPWYVQKTTDEDERELARPGYRRCCMLWEMKQI